MDKLSKNVLTLKSTGHFIVLVVLGAQIFENDHTTLYIKEKLRQMIDKFLLLRENMVNMNR